MSRLVAFRTAHGKYLCAEPDGTLVANRDAIGPWETFEEIEVGGVANGPNIITPPTTGPSAPEPTPNLQPRLIQVTNEPGIVNRFYSYWSACWLDSDGRTALVMATTESGPVLFEVRLKPDPEVRRIGPLNGYGGTGEGMYFTPGGQVMALDGPRLRRSWPFTGRSEVVFDISERFPGCRLWQAHSSDDGQTHSATVQRIVSDGAYPRIGTVVWRRGELHWFPSPGNLDESQVDRSGEFVVIKEGDDNFVITLGSDRTRIIADRDGALGHSDCGAGFMVGEDNINGKCVRVDLRTLDRRPLFDTWNMGHVSVRAGRCLLSDSRRLALVDLGGHGVTDLVEHGMTGSGYEAQPNANLSPCGKLAAFVSNKTGSMQVYLQVIG